MEEHGAHGAAATAPPSSSIRSWSRFRPGKWARIGLAPRTPRPPDFGGRAAAGGARQTASRPGCRCHPLRLGESRAAYAHPLCHEDTSITSPGPDSRALGSRKENCMPREYHDLAYDDRFDSIFNRNLEDEIDGVVLRHAAACPCHVRRCLRPPHGGTSCF